MDEDYYDNYSILYGENEEENKTLYPKELLDYYDKCFEKIRGLTTENNVLDIGCASGEMLCLLSKYFSQVQGIEPSKKLAEKAAQKGFHISNDYFNKNICFQKKFNLITCLMVLEHVNDLNDFLEAIVDNLEDNGILMINVPNGSKIVESMSYFDIYPEHINYFTEKSLMELAFNHGLKLIYMEQVYGNGYHLTAFFKKKSRKYLFSVKKEMDIIKINHILKDIETVGVWGIGTRARNILNLINRENALKIKFLFDRNIGLKGKMIPYFDKLIMMPEEDKIKECDLIIVSSLEYYMEIIKSLRENYCYQGKICYMGEDQFVLY